MSKRGREETKIDSSVDATSSLSPAIERDVIVDDRRKKKAKIADLDSDDDDSKWMKPKPGHKKTRIGAEYQAMIPDCTPRKPTEKKA